MNVRYRVTLSSEERMELEALVRGGKGPVRRLKRAQILLASDAGSTIEVIAANVAVGTSTVYRTRQRFVEDGLETALSEELRPGVDRKLSSAEEALLVATACTKPPGGRARWTMELLAGEKGDRPVKVALMDQRVVAGLGNIYADEALHRAGIRPQRPTSSLTNMQMKLLYRAICDVLNDGIEAAEKELAWRYQNRNSPSPFRVYDRDGQPCLGCGTTLSSTSLAGRTTVWCPRCQS